MFLKNNDDNSLQKPSTETKIAAIFYVNATRVCKMQFHWSSQMERPGINQSALATHQPYQNSVFLVSSATRTQFVPAFTHFGHFKHFSRLSSQPGQHFCVSPDLSVCAKDHVVGVLRW